MLLFISVLRILRFIVQTRRYQLCCIYSMNCCNSFVDFISRVWSYPHQADSCKVRRLMIDQSRELGSRANRVAFGCPSGRVVFSSDLS